MNFHISVGWIPANVGIDYNKKVDNLAKTVLKQGQISANGQIEICLPVCKKLLAGHIRRLW